MASKSAEDWKAQGNAHFAEQRYNEAVTCYTKALEAYNAKPGEGKPSVYLSNRSASYFQLKQYKSALEDASKAAQLDPTWPKAQWRKSNALSALGRDREALQAVLAARALSGSSIDPSLSDDVKTCWSSYIAAYFRIRTSSLNVEVKWIDEVMGRGVFNMKEGTTDENIIIFREKPLVSQLRPGSRLACSHCLHTKLEAEDMAPHFTGQYPFLYPDLEGRHSWSQCPHCSDKYCNDSCRGQAALRYHELLCTSAPWWVESHKNDPLPHPMETIMNRCLEGKPAFINPMLISRMISGIVTHIASHKATQQSIDEALEPYRLFSAGEKAPQIMASITITCLRALYHCKYNGQPELLKTLDTVVTEDLYHELHGIISRNAHHLNPLSDFHLFLEGLNQFNQHLLVATYDEDMSPTEFVQSDFMRNLTVEGTGLFEVANSINHSCEPNSMVVHCNADYTISVVSKVPIKHGTELTISYIDETLPKAERQARLKEFYGFECKCSKCLTEPE